MTRLGWSHSRSRTRSGGEKNHVAGAHEWFSRTAGEPSRQALTDLVEKHKREKSEGSSTSKSSRASRTLFRRDTVSPVDWENDQSRPSSRGEAGSYPTSPVHAREGSIISALDRSENVAKALLTKGGQILKRKNSKMSISSFNSFSHQGMTASSRSSSVHGLSSMSSSSALRGDDLRKAISSPFDFQHVTHTEQTQFSTLSAINEAELASKFTSITSQQHCERELRGINATDIHTDDQTPHISPPSPSSPRLPMTPPRPLPPPKDLPEMPVLPLNFGETRFSYNWSRPHPQVPRSPTQISAAETRSSPTLPESRLSHVSVNQLNLDSKPLPQTPDIIHAVSTLDNTAQPMITAPLPTPPIEGREHHQPKQVGPAYHHRKTSSGLRHMSTFPPPERRADNLSIQQPILEETGYLPRHRSEMGLFEQARKKEKSKVNRISIGLRTIETADWEGAIDDAWDVSSDETPLDTTEDDAFVDQTLLHGQYIPHGAMSSESSPGLTMAGPQPPTDIRSLNPTPRPGMNGGRDLLGLGIQSPRSNPFQSGAYLENGSNSNLTTEEIPGALSKSSSQESMMFSNTSSILGTQRSSNSSVSFSDFAHIVRHEEFLQSYQDKPSPMISQPSPKSPAPKRKSVRPESGCLPTGVTGLISTVEESNDESENQSEDSTFDSTPTVSSTTHKHAISASKLPQRRSSIQGDPTQATRKRAQTLGSRPRTSGRISYSLFPSPPQSQRPTAST